MSLVDVVHSKLLCKMVGEDEKLTSKSKVNLAHLLPCHSLLNPHIQYVNHHITWYKRADEAILEKSKPYNEGQGWMRTDEECWNQSDLAVLSYQHCWLISWTLVIVRRRRRTLMVSLKAMMTDGSDSCQPFP